MSTANGPQAPFSVGDVWVTEAGISLDQQMTVRLVDHRGALEMPAYAVMAESVTCCAPPPSWPTADVAGGPLCDLLAMTVRLDDEPVMTVEPQSWMANPLGAIQGGVIASLIGQACSLGGQAHTGPGDSYTLSDLSVHYFRSPPVDGRSLTLATTTERIGRRMATVSATMTDHGGTDYVRAVANIAHERARAF